MDDQEKDEIASCPHGIEEYFCDLCRRVISIKCPICKNGEICSICQKYLCLSHSKETCFDHLPITEKDN